MDTPTNKADLIKAAVEAEEKANHWATIAEVTRAEAAHYGKMSEEADARAAQFAAEAARAKEKAGLMKTMVDEITSEASRYAKEAEEARARANSAL